MPFEIIRNDITNVRADAIVNTANPEPVIGRGTDMAIHQKAGPELLEERKRIGRIEPGCSAATSAYGLDARYVIHTVTTNWIDGKHGETEILRKAYDSALELADGLGCESIAFPLMSSGTYGFPKETAMSVAIGAFTDFLLKHDMDILLVVFSAEAYSLAGSLFDDVRSFVDDNYVRERSLWERRSDSHLPGAERREEGYGQGHFPAPVSSSRPSIHSIFSSWIAAEDEEEDIELEESREPEDKSEGARHNGTEAAQSLEEILRSRESTFVEFLRDMIREKEMKDPDIYRRAGISRQHFNKMINDLEYQPTKRTVWQLIVGMQLNMNEAKKLMEKAGFSMTRSNKTDLVMEYYILHRRYSIIEIDIALLDAGLPTLTRG